MTITGAAARWALEGSAVHTKTNVNGRASVGVSGGYKAFSDADVLYSFTVTADALGDVATLNLGTGVVAQTTGTPTITDGDGNDFEGVTLPALASLYGLLLVGGASNGTDGVLVEPSNTKFPTMYLYASEINLNVIPVAYSLGGGIGTLVMSFEAAADSITVTVLGKAV